MILRKYKYLIINMDRLKEKLIINRLNRVYCRLKPSPIHGVGVFAIKRIPLGTNPFKDSYIAQGAILISKDKITNEYSNMLEDYHPSDSGTKWQIVSDYPNQPIWTNYLNYSDTPNIQLMDDGEWKTLRDVEVGEELVEDPKRLFNEDGSYKTFRVRPKQYPELH